MNSPWTMDMTWLALALIAAVLLFRPLRRRIELSRAKHPSLGGHGRISRRLARLVPHYEYGEGEAFRCDGAPPDVVRIRTTAIGQLAVRLSGTAPKTLAEGAALRPSVPDMQFTNSYRVPFQFRSLARKLLDVGAIADASDGVRIRDLDGNWSYDVGGSYGVNLLGYDFYKACIDRGAERVRELGPVLGLYHPLIAENVSWLRQISGLDEVSFHMSGTEAVMQAVRLARFHSGRSQLVMFCGAYHGWWDGVQPGVGNRRSPDDIFSLSDMSEASLRVLRNRKDIACVLINPLQALHPNSGADSDAMLINSERRADFNREAYAHWLRTLREVCTERGIALIFDEVFVGFRLGLGGAQEYFGVKADMVTYGKTVGGGLPVGVLCGKSSLMKRYRDSRPLDICFARGTFNSHPYVMGSMYEFLKYARSDEFSCLVAGSHSTWDARAGRLNRELERRQLPVRVANLSSIWVFTFTQVSRFNWLYQYYLRAEGLSLSWVGTGRLIFSLNYTEEDFAAVSERILRAAECMADGGWWWRNESLTNQSIKRQVMREMIGRRLSA